MSQRAVPAVWMRGGTSKGLFFHERDLPADAEARERLLLAAVGSPDPLGGQIDGMGCGTSNTSKLVIIGPPPDDAHHVSYTFGHAAIQRPLIDWAGNCGNLSAAVGLFAVEQGLVPLTEGVTEVLVWQTNLRHSLRVRLPVRDGEVLLEGDFRQAGTPNPGAPLWVDFLRPGGGEGGRVLPTGLPQQALDVPDVGEVQVSLVHAGNATVFVRAFDMGLTGTELPHQLNQDVQLLEWLDAIRCEAAVAMGLVASADEARENMPSVPKLSFVSESQLSPTIGGELIPAEEMDCCARIVSMGRLHQAFTGTGTIAMAVAAAVPGTLVHDALRKPKAPGEPLVFGHPAGIAEVGAEVREMDGEWYAESAGFRRTARTLMRGEVMVRGDGV